MGKEEEIEDKLQIGNLKALKGLNYKIDYEEKDGYFYLVGISENGGRHELGKIKM